MIIDDSLQKKLTGHELMMMMMMQGMHGDSGELSCGGAGEQADGRVQKILR